MLFYLCVHDQLSLSNSAMTPSESQEKKCHLFLVKLISARPGFWWGRHGYNFQDYDPSLWKEQLVKNVNSWRSVLYM